MQSISTTQATMHVRSGDKKDRRDLQNILQLLQMIGDGTSSLRLSAPDNSLKLYLKIPSPSILTLSVLPTFM